MDELAEFFVIEDYQDILAREDGFISEDDGLADSDLEDGELISDVEESVDEVEDDQVGTAGNLLVADNVVDDRVSFHHN
jgi:hypothetical protein